jgi:hypothetical protein
MNFYGLQERGVKVFVGGSAGAVRVQWQEVPRQLGDVPLDLEVVQLGRLEGNFVIISGGEDGIASEVDGSGNRSLSFSWELTFVIHEKTAHHSVHDGMLAEEDDLARGRDGDLLVELLPVAESEGVLDAVSKLLEARSLGALEGLGSGQNPGISVRGEQLLVRGPAEHLRRVVRDDGAAGNERVLEVVDEISRIFDTDTESDQVFWETSFRSDSSRDGGVPAVSRSRIRHRDGLTT